MSPCLVYVQLVWELWLEGERRPKSRVYIGSDSYQKLKEVNTCTYKQYCDGPQHLREDVRLALVIVYVSVSTWPCDPNENLLRFRQQSHLTLFSSSEHLGRS